MYAMNAPSSASSRMARFRKFQGVTGLRRTPRDRSLQCRSGESRPAVLAGVLLVGLLAGAGARGDIPRQHALLGAWTFDPAASRFDGGIPYTRATSRFTAAADCIQVAVEIVEGNDHHIRFEYCDRGDGTDAPVKGNPFYDGETTAWPTPFIAVRTEKRAGKATGTTMMTVAADGKSYTATASRTRPDGIKYTSSIVWRRVSSR